jgi:hypothetical protein
VPDAATRFSHRFAREVIEPLLATEWPQTARAPAESIQ